MLSEKTKFIRINEKLYNYGIALIFPCFDLKTYTPSITDKQEDGYKGSENFRRYLYYGVKIYVYQDKSSNLVKFRVAEVQSHNFVTNKEFEDYKNWLKNIDLTIKYCNSLNLSVPKYNGGVAFEDC